MKSLLLIAFALSGFVAVDSARAQSEVCDVIGTPVVRINWDPGLGQSMPPPTNYPGGGAACTNVHLWPMSTESLNEGASWTLDVPMEEYQGSVGAVQSWYISLKLERFAPNGMSTRDMPMLALMRLELAEDSSSKVRGVVQVAIQRRSNGGFDVLVAPSQKLPYQRIASVPPPAPNTRPVVDIGISSSGTWSEFIGPSTLTVMVGGYGSITLENTGLRLATVRIGNFGAVNLPGDSTVYFTATEHMR